MTAQYGSATGVVIAAVVPTLRKQLSGTAPCILLCRQLAF